MAALVSVIVPTHNEAGCLPAAVRSVRQDPDVEVVVADGGSDDGTRELARGIADSVVDARRGRAPQLNAGAAAARGSLLLFLHADSTVAPGAIAALRQALANPRVAGGSFRVRIGTGLGLRLISWGSNLRTRWLKLPYGDQALFVRSTTFLDVGGYHDLEIMEDVDFVRRIRRLGRLALVDLPVETSSRRWRSRGVLRTTLANASALTLFQLGVSTLRIRRYYDALVAVEPSHDDHPS